MTKFSTLQEYPKEQYNQTYAHLAVWICNEGKCINDAG